MAGEGVDDEMQDRLPNLVSLLHWGRRMGRLSTLV